MQHRLTLLALVLLAGAPPFAAAQTGRRVFVAPAGGVVVSGSERVDGTSGTPGLSAGMQFTPRFGVEVEIKCPFGDFDHAYTGPSISFASPDIPREQLAETFVISRFATTRHVGSVITVAGVYQFGFRRRMAPRVAIGMNNQHATTVRTITTVRLPPDVTQAQVDAAMPPVERVTENLGAVAIGAGVCVMVTPRVWVLPEVRYHYGSIGDQIENVTYAGGRLLLWF